MGSRKLLFFVLGMAPLAAVWAQDADILMVVGRGEVRAAGQTTWQVAKVQQKLEVGSFVRTPEGGQMALLLRDQTQVRLNQNSLLEIKSVQSGEQATELSLVQGRLWAQVKQLSKGTLRAVSSLVRPQQVRVVTPTATVGIRGTDWELVVGDQGATTVTVLSGEVEMSNPLGQVLVGPNEQAVAEVGKAPVKSLLSNARDRVQWVTAYRPSPQRWLPDPPPALSAVVQDIAAGEYAKALTRLEADRASPGAALLLADMYLYVGRSNDAMTLLAPLSQDGRGSPAATALHARALLLAGQPEAAGALLRTGYGSHPADREIVLALGDVARIQGDADAAVRWFTQVTLAHPQSHEAWFGLGRVEVEKENIGTAKRALNEAIRLAPNAPGYAGERATLLALSGENVAARAAFDDALQRHPDDYLAWTGLGILQLKTGQAQQALESFLKAGVIEPRFARGHIYSGVAYYQLGNTQRARESMGKAAELDAKDPLPYVMLGLMYGDAQELGLAVDAARQAQQRLPYLKSLNQLLNDQKGSANMGAALASKGLEEWARSFAADSYNPYWAGSALFLADRYADGFNKNSELYRGFLLDPTSFGASNRNSSLLASGGHYGSLALGYERADFNEKVGQLALNGLTTGAIPLAYSVLAQRAAGNASDATLNGNGENLTVGLGMRPNYDTNVFYFGTRSTVRGGLTNPPDPAELSLTNVPFKVKISRQDLGLGYQLSSNHRMMFKYGEGSQRTRLSGDIVAAAIADSLTTAFAEIPALQPFSAAGTLDNYGTTVRQKDFQFNDTFNLLPHLRLSWGFEAGSERRDVNYINSFPSNLAPDFPAQIQINADRRLKSTDLYVSGRSKVHDALEWQADLARQQLRGNARINSQVDLIGAGNLTDTTDNESERISQTNLRMGLRLSPAQGHQIRLVSQNWRRPMGAASLGPVDTLGIPVEDQLVQAGGLLRRTRVQYDWQQSDTSFVQVVADHRRVVNLQSAVAPLVAIFDVTELDSLRTRKPVFGQAFNDLEATPTFVQGRVSSIGAAGNWLLNRSVSLASRYTLASSRNTGAGLEGLKVPLIPRHFANASVYWHSTNRWLVSANSTYRSARYSDEGNLAPLAAGWSFGVASYWESEDKRLAVEAALGNLHANKRSSLERLAKFSLNGILRF